MRDGRCHEVRMETGEVKCMPRLMRGWTFREHEPENLIETGYDKYYLLGCGVTCQKLLP
jgi:hypothetical protein